MRRVRVLVVDDSAAFRRLLVGALSREPDIEVVGAAADGREALAAVDRVAPDLLTLDVEMPQMDGLQILGELRKGRPGLPVIMLSAVTTQAAAVTLQALALGASDYVTKPEHCDLASATAHLREQLLPRIRALSPPSGPALAPPAAAGVPTAQGEASSAASLPSSSRLRARHATLDARVDVVAIGASTGGPHALMTLLGSLSASLPVPVVIAQHMPPVFTRLMAERLAATSGLRVTEAIHGAALEPGAVLVAPGDHHLVVRPKRGGASVELTRDPPENSCRPAVDVLFRSVADVFGAHVLAVVLTGMGQDGLRGCERVRGAGGQVLAQDEATSVVWGMPGVVARAGLADAVVSLDRLGRELSNRVWRDRSSTDHGGAYPPPARE